MEDKSVFMYENSLIMDAASSWGYIREPVLALMPDGKLICTFLSGGKQEPENGNVTLKVMSTDGGRHWSDPEVLFYHRARAAYTTEIFTGGEHPKMFVHTYAAESRYREICTFVSETIDNGETWSDPISFPGPFAHVNTRQGILLSDGNWLFPVYWQEVDRKWDWEQIPTENSIHMDWPSVCGVLLSEGAGVHMQCYGELRSKEYPLMENACIELEKEHIAMLIRAEGCNFLYRSDSYDNGKHWSPAGLCNIPSVSSKFVLKKYKDKILLIHNAVQGEGMQSRTGLSIWVSEDNMQSWNRRYPLVKEGVIMFYPHAAVDEQKGILYLACENARQSYCVRIDLQALLTE